MYGIYGGGGECHMISEKSINNWVIGIYSRRSYASITGNYIMETTDYGIRVYIAGDYSVISGNMVRYLNANNSETRYGIFVNGEYSIISENAVYSCINVGTGTSYAIGIGAGGNNCMVYSNVTFNNDNSFYAVALVAETIIGNALNNQFP